MAGKPVLHYLNSRGRMELIRWLLAAAGVEVGSAWGHLLWDVRLTFAKYSSMPRYFHTT
jgi:hypothetical protein